MPPKTITDLSPPVVKQPVWDLPTRLFHWLLVALIAFSWWSGKNDRVELHVWSGYGVLTLLIFRILWGFVGSSTARFANFVRGPRAVLGSVRGRWRGVGHTPLGALSVVALLSLIALQVATGLINTDEDGLAEGALAPLVNSTTSQLVHELHFGLFYILLWFIGLHIAAILFYRLFLGKNLFGPMITGRAALDPGAVPMRPAKWWVALLCLAAAIAVTRWVIAGAPPFSS